MDNETIIKTLKRYLKSLTIKGIHPVCGVLFGSFAHGKTHEWSDIDLVVIAPEFDQSPNIRLIEQLWSATSFGDDRIEPIACGEREWETNHSRPILEIARKEGIVITI